MSGKARWKTAEELVNEQSSKIDGRAVIVIIVENFRGLDDKAELQMSYRGPAGFASAILGRCMEETIAKDGDVIAQFNASHGKH